MKGKLLAVVVVLMIAAAAWVLVARARRQSRSLGPSHTVKLTWVGSARARTYNVYRSQNGEPYRVPLVTGLTSRSYTDSTVSAGQTYFYAVTAVNEFGESAKSNEAKAVIPNPWENKEAIPSKGWAWAEAHEEENGPQLRLTADFDCDGKADTVMLGSEKGRVVVGIVWGAPKKLG